MKKTSIHIALIIGALLTILPFFWMVLTSFKTMTEATQIPLVFFPEVWNLNNYKEALAILPFGTYYLNTILMTIGRTVGQIVFCSMAAYAFGRIEFPGKNFIFAAILSILMVPGQIFLVPQYMIMNKLHLLNTITALILPGMFSAFGTFLMVQFFRTIPKSLEDAAIIDGCSHFKVYYRIMMPLVIPGISALTIFTVLYSWNDLLWPLICNTSMDKLTLSVGLASLKGQHLTNYPVLMAGCIIAIWPMILMFIILQRTFVESIAMSGIK
ncbi:carbohydrate ABC transporter permease [Vallitalea okinawensis]|uniref:carbohydrate ABC transporter permease n=1 Tax=Vallitalea okinawensis TaxID=2078660 RepID=UPI000CFDC26F|nr:carbohydrate ABC transporter permease [Vallitalea okinawensis]